MSGSTSVRAIRIELTNVGAIALYRPRPPKTCCRRQVLAEALIERAAEQVMAACDPAEDLRGDVEYKTHMAAEMARRSIRDALARARS